LGVFVEHIGWAAKVVLVSVGWFPVRLAEFVNGDNAFVLVGQVFLVSLAYLIAYG